jgi:hypothetical protein
MLNDETEKKNYQLKKINKTGVNPLNPWHGLQDRANHV